MTDYRLTFHHKSGMLSEVLTVAPDRRSALATADAMLANDDDYATLTFGGSDPIFWFVVETAVSDLPIPFAQGHRIAAAIAGLPRSMTVRLYGGPGGFLISAADQSTAAVALLPFNAPPAYAPRIASEFPAFVNALNG